MNAPSAKSPALQALRTATQPLHEFLDSRLAVGRGDAALVDYMAHLSTLHPWLVDLRGALIAAGDPALDGVVRRIDRSLKAIILDLDDTGCTPSGEAPRAAPPFGNDAVTPGFAWGLAYVFEGSQLGGAVMHKRLHERLAPHPLRYFQPVEGETVASGWQAFMTALGAHVSEGSATEAAQRGAVAGFEALIARFGLGQPA